MLNNPFYHGLIKKVIIGFGHLFSSIRIERKEADTVNGPTIQTLQVPISYAPREKWLVRLEQDPNLENHTYTSLPRMSFEITGYLYDAERKLGKANQIICRAPDGASVTYSPVPYNLNLSLYILTKNQEDGLQIIEQILPSFQPEYTLSINAIPDMNIIQDIPIIINGVDVEDEYEGNFETRRFVTHILDFTAKLNLYGPVSTRKPIYHTDVNISQNPSFRPVQLHHHADGDPDTGEITEYWDRTL